MRKPQKSTVFYVQQQNEHGTWDTHGEGFLNEAACVARLRQLEAKSLEAVMTWLKLIKNSVDVAGFPPRAHSQVASAILDMAKMLPRDKAWQGDLKPLIAAAKALKSKADKRMNAQVKNMHPDSERRA